MYTTTWSASRDPDTGQCQTGYAVVDDHGVVQSSPLPSHYSAQAAELVALTEACKLAEGKTVTIYADSRYAFGVVHDFGALWKHRKFLKSDGKPILHHDKISALLEAILLPKQISVCKCAAHTSSEDVISRGNARADSAAKVAVRRPINVKHETTALLSHSVASLSDLSSFVTPAEKKLWIQNNCYQKEGVWYGPDDKPCLPKKLYPCFAKLSHGLDHVSKTGMCAVIQADWYTKGFSTFAADFCRSCMICAMICFPPALNQDSVIPVNAEPASEALTRCLLTVADNLTAVGRGLEMSNQTACRQSIMNIGRGKDQRYYNSAVCLQFCDQDLLLPDISTDKSLRSKSEKVTQPFGICRGVNQTCANRSHTTSGFSASGQFLGNSSCAKVEASEGCSHSRSEVCMKVNLILPGGNISGVKVVRSTPGLGMMKGYAWVCGNQYYTFLPPMYARY